MSALLFVDEEMYSVVGGDTSTVRDEFQLDRLASEISSHGINLSVASESGGLLSHPKVLLVHGSASLTTVHESWSLSDAAELDVIVLESQPNAFVRAREEGWTGFVDTVSMALWRHGHVGRQTVTVSDTIAQEISGIEAEEGRSRTLGYTAIDGQGERFLPAALAAVIRTLTEAATQP